jgi:pantoate--beta-alanine ligase
VNEPLVNEPLVNEPLVNEPLGPAAVKVRTELELPLPEGDEAADQFMRLLAHLGYRPTAVVRKRRRSYRLQRGGFDLTVCLDEVEGLGRFAEVEVLAPQEQLPAARSALQDTAKALGLTDVEPRSYLGLVLAAQASRGRQPPELGPAGQRPAVVSAPDALRQAVADARRRGLTIGLVPTMGALHRGHTSLMDLARAETGFVAVSLFINPIQFGPHEDLSRYPRPLEHDLAQCTLAGVDLVFVPDAALMYPPGFRTYVEVTGLQDGLCGASRPGHFRGVCTVVLKLFNLVQPDVAYFGQKDYQQARIIRQMVRDLEVPVRLRVGPTVREPDGLALSSRNQYLEPAQRREAPALYDALAEAWELAEDGERDAAALRRLLVDRMAATPGAALDYAAVVDADTLEPVDRLRGPTLLALAVKFGATRLIDNLVWEP